MPNSSHYNAVVRSDHSTIYGLATPLLWPATAKNVYTNVDLPRPEYTRRSTTQLSTVTYGPVNLIPTK